MNKLKRIFVKAKVNGLTFSYKVSDWLQNPIY